MLRLRPYTGLKLDVTYDFAPYHYQVVTVGIEFTPQDLYIEDAAPPKSAKSLTDKNVLHYLLPQGGVQVVGRVGVTDFAGMSALLREASVWHKSRFTAFTSRRQACRPQTGRFAGQKPNWVKLALALRINGLQMVRAVER